MACRATLAGAVLLLLTACADTAETTAPPDEPTTTAPTTAPATTLPPPLTTTTIAPTTTAASTTTTAAPTTTAPPPTTAPAPPVHSGPTIPAALSRAVVPWSDVGAGWHLIIYESTKVDLSEVVEGPTLLYLVDPAGTLYEIGAWDGFPLPFALLDWRPDGTEALVRIGRGPAGPDQIGVLDLTNGTTTVLGEVTMAEAESFGPLAGYTRPTGANHVFFRNDGATEQLERRSPAGTLLATLWEQPAVPGPEGLTWLYGFDGTTVVVGHEGGLTLVANDGAPIRDLWAPPERSCAPVRWWTATQLLASCRTTGPESPHDFYSQLWLLPIDGTAGSALEALPSGEVPVVDFGHSDAWATAAGVRIQWWGDCGAAAVRELAADGSAVPMTAGFEADGYQMIDVSGDRIAVMGWAGCGGEGGELLTTDLDLGDPEVLIPRLEAVIGVIDAAGLAEVHP